MYEGTIPLEDFLRTMNELQADFERRLGGIECGADSVPPATGREQERSGSSRWTEPDDDRPLGLEAIWNTPRRSSAARAGEGWRPAAAYRPHAPDATPEEGFVRHR
jgi:hypothetical protein